MYGGGKLALFLFAGSCFAGQSVVTPVNCTGNPSDRAMIQAAIDNAASGATLMLNGTCQLDGERLFINKSNLTLTGAGAAGGWSSVIKGIAGPDGKPEGNPNLDTLNNLGIYFGDPNTGNSVISNVTISNLKFTTLLNAVAVDPQNGYNSVRCKDTHIGKGSANDVIIEDNWFDNNNRAVQNFGSSSNLKIRNNNITNGQGVVNLGLFGLGVACYNDNDERVSLGGLGIATNTSMTGNSMSSSQFTSCRALEATYTNGLDFSNNNIAIAPKFFMVELTNARNSRFMKNDFNAANPEGYFSPGFLMIEDPTEQPSINNVMSNNTFSNMGVGFFLIGEYAGATGYSMVNNRFIDMDPDFPDIVLAGPEFFGLPASHDNKVVTTNFSTRVLDGGVNNKLLGTQNFMTNPKVSDTVKAIKADKALGRPQTVVPTKP